MANEVNNKDLEELLIENQSNPKNDRLPVSWNPSSMHVKSFKRTIRTLQLDHSQKWWGLVSWIVGFVMILVIPILRLIYVKAGDNKSNHQLVFQPIVVVTGILISAISFIFLSLSMRKYGVQGILFLDMAEEEPTDIREEYNKIIQVLNLVNLTGLGLCLKLASKISHLHRRIVKTASSVHAKATFAAANGYALSRGSGFQEKMERLCQAQDAWSRRAALVNFLTNNTAGISLYGFVLDRFFVHTSIGALLTTTWFLLGRSLSG
uniref:Uncharacterized protein n=1 Tax=Araucaria cunninghamii TaxID=56994 RepID=A0A0D6R1T1_ARACU